MPESMQTWLEHAPRPEPLAAGQEWNIFLSYRSVNRTWVINLYDVLRTHGHQVYLDQCALVGGTSLVGELQKALRKSQAGVLVWSAAARDSTWVQREYEVMEGKADEGFRFVPVRVDGTPFPEFAARRVFLDFSQYPDGPNGGELLRLMHAVVGKALSPEAARFANDQDEAAQAASDAIKAAVLNGRAEKLLELVATGGLVWDTAAALGCAAANGLIGLKRVDDAIAVLGALEQRFPRAIRVKQLRALALARRKQPGDLDQAQDILGQLYAGGHKDPETLGIYGRTWMDRYAGSGDSLDLARSRDLYAEGFEAAQDDYYTGINAASKSVLLGTPDDLALGKSLAEKVQAIVGAAPTRGDYWKTATTAEVQLLQGHYAEAGKLYAAAVGMAPKEKANHESSWLQAFRLMAALGPGDADRALVRNAFGHLPDDPTR